MGSMVSFYNIESEKSGRDRKLSQGYDEIGEQEL